MLRPLSSDDGDAVGAIDREYASRTGSEALIDASSLSFYSRTGHSFVIEEHGAVRGFVLAQAVWDGRRPTVFIRRVEAAEDRGREALLAAVTKSAYDSGVYDLLAELPEADQAGVPALDANGYVARPSRLFARVLGSRSQGERQSGE